MMTFSFSAIHFPTSSLSWFPSCWCAPRLKQMAALLLSPPPPLSLSTEASLLSLLEKCSAMQEVKQLHAQMIKTSLVLHPIPASRLLAAVSRTTETKRLDYLLLLFNSINNPTTFMWNTMIRAHSTSINPQQAILLYCQMLHTGAPLNAYTFPFLLKSCARLSPALEETQQIHCHIIKTGSADDVYTANSLLHIYAKSGKTFSARKLFDRIPSRDTVSWNSMIDGYAKSGSIEMARELFNKMEAKDVVTWTSMITGYVDSCLFKEALELFQEMQAMGSVEYDSVLMASVLSACAQLGALDQGRWIHNHIKKGGVQVDQVLGCVLVDMYAKCGELDEALNVFRAMEERNLPVWTAMITGLAAHGGGKEALNLFADMEEGGIKPNAITCTALLTACSHAGMVEEGRSLFKRMEKDYGIRPSIEHYGCLVDLLGRAGLLEEAEELIKAMPMKPNVAVWGALLNACRVHKNFDLGGRIGKILIGLEPNHGGRYVQLATILAAQRKWDEAANVRELMKQRGVRKLPGCSLISLDGIVHEFVSGDRSHVQAEEIYAQWKEILKRLESQGYVPKTQDLLLDLEVEEKETAVHWHSEKLAVAFGIIKTEPGRAVHIFKNLRVCTDCHTVMKLISKVYGRKIIMRDRSRFHCFVDGYCSCNDYW